MSSKLMVCNLFLVCLIGYTWNVYGLQTSQQKDVSEAISLSSEVGEDVMDGGKREENGEAPLPNKADSLSKTEKREDEFVESPPPDAKSLDERELHLRRASKWLGCRDKSKHCKYWASVGECCVNPKYMHKNCRKSCKLCGGCRDLSQNCEKWRPSCCTNKDYMHTYCKKTCAVCKLRH